MGKLLRNALVRWIAPKPADEMGSELEPRPAPRRAAQSASQRRLVLDPKTGQIRRKVDIEAEKEVAARKRLKSIQIAEETYD